MSQMPRPVLFLVVGLLAVAAAFGLASGFNMAGGNRGGFDREAASTSPSTTPLVADAKPIDPNAPADAPPVLTPEEEAAKKAADDARKAEADKKAAELAALPKDPQAYIPPPPTGPKSDAPLPLPPIEGPPPATPEQTGPNLY